MPTGEPGKRWCTYGQHYACAHTFVSKRCCPACAHLRKMRRVPAPPSPAPEPECAWPEDRIAALLRRNREEVLSQLGGGR